MYREDIYKRAEKKVNAKKGFFVHLGVFIAVGLFFLLMNIATFGEEGRVWFFFPLLPWSVGLFIHYFIIFGLPGTRILTAEWEKEEFEKEVRNILYEEGPFLDAPHEPNEIELTDEERLELKELRELKRQNWDDKDLV